MGHLLTSIVARLESVYTRRRESENPHIGLVHSTYPSPGGPSSSNPEGRRHRTKACPVAPEEGGGQVPRRERWVGIERAQRRAGHGV